MGKANVVCQMSNWLAETCLLCLVAWLAELHGLQQTDGGGLPLMEGWGTLLGNH